MLFIAPACLPVLISETSAPSWASSTLSASIRRCNMSFNCAMVCFDVALRRAKPRAGPFGSMCSAPNVDDACFYPNQRAVSRIKIS